MVVYGNIKTPKGTVYRLFAWLANIDTLGTTKNKYGIDLLEDPIIPEAALQTLL